MTLTPSEHDMMFEYSNPNHFTKSLKAWVNKEKLFYYQISISNL